MKNQFVGPMGKMMKRYLTLQRSLGPVLRSAEFILDAFDRYLSVHFPKIKQITRNVVMDYLATTAHLHSTTRRNYLRGRGVF